MKSKECLDRIIFEAKAKKPIFSMYYQEFLRPIEKDLEILECFKKIPKQDLKDFIEWQLRYEKNMKTWLEERHFCYIGKEEEYTKHLIKIKEWLDEEEKEERVEND